MALSNFFDCFVYFINGSSRKAWLLITIFATSVSFSSSPFFWEGIGKMKRINKVVFKSHAFLLDLIDGICLCLLSIQYTLLYLNFYTTYNIMPPKCEIMHDQIAHNLVITHSTMRYPPFLPTLLHFLYCFLKYLNTCC